MSNQLPEAAFHREAVERRPADLTQGGLILLLLGTDQDCPSKYTLHGQVKPIMGSNIRGGRDMDVHIPQNTKIVIFQGRLASAAVFKGAHDVLKRRRLPYLIRDNATAVEAAIDDLLAVPKDRAQEVAVGKVTLGQAAATPVGDGKREIAERGSIKAFIETELPAMLKAEPQATSAELARKLFRIAQDKAISTTEGSLTQGIRMWKKDHRYTERPESIKTDEQKAIGGIEEAIELTRQALKRMEAIKGLYLSQREELLAAQAEVKELRKKVARAAEVFAAFREEIE